MVTGIGEVGGATQESGPLAAGLRLRRGRVGLLGLGVALLCPGPDAAWAAESGELQTWYRAYADRELHAAQRAANSPGHSDWWISASAAIIQEPTQGGAVALGYLRRGTEWRLGVGQLRMTRETRLGSFDAREAFASSNLSGYVDWYPFSGGFHLGAGIVLQTAETELTATPDPDRVFTINGRLYTSEQLGSLRGTIRYSPAVPYVGVGWSQRVDRWRLRSDFGVVFNLQPELELKSGSTLAGSETDLQALAAELQKDIDNFYALVSLGISYGL